MPATSAVPLTFIPSDKRKMPRKSSRDNAAGKTHAGVERAFAGPDIVLGRCDFGATGFYSYSDGEIAPMESSTLCDLHNQTMTITTLAEA